MSEPLPAAAYVLPGFIPEEMQVLHAELISRLRAEADHLPHMNTIAELLIERIAFNYIILKYKESASDDNGRIGFTHERNAKEFNTFWLTMTQEFNKLTRTGFEAAELRDLIVGQVSEAMTTVLADLDPSQGAQLRDRFSEAFSEIGL